MDIILTSSALILPFSIVIPLKKFNCLDDNYDTAVVVGSPLLLLVITLLIR